MRVDSNNNYYPYFVVILHSSLRNFINVSFFSFAFNFFSFISSSTLVATNSSKAPLRSFARSNKYLSSNTNFGSSFSQVEKAET